MLGVVHVYRAIGGTRSKYVTLLSEEECWILSLNLVTQSAVLESLVLDEVLLYCGGVEPVPGVDAGVALDNGYDFRAFVVEYLRKVVTDITQALNDYSLTFDSGAQVSSLTERVVIEQLPEHIEAAQAG